MVKLGFPIALQDGLVSVSFLVLMAIINDLGIIHSAGIGVAQKLCSFIMLVPSSFAQSLSAFVAQNIGAGKPDRARKSMLCGMAVSFLIGIVDGICIIFPWRYFLPKYLPRMVVSHSGSSRLSEGLCN